MMKRKLLSILALLCLTVSGAGAQTYTNTVNINEASGDVEVNSGHWLITGTGEPTTNTIVISGGWVTLSNVNISSSNKPCIECKTYDTYIFLADETKNTLTATGEKKAPDFMNEAPYRALFQTAISPSPAICSKKVIAR